MVTAYIMVKSTAGQSRALLERVRDVDGVTEANIVAGEYDVVVETDAPEVYEVMGTVVADIRALDGVVDTRTYVCLE